MDQLRTEPQTTPTPGEDRRERKELGDRCGGAGWVRCAFDLYCADRTELAPWEEKASDVMGECRSCDDLVGKERDACQRMSRAPGQTFDAKVEDQPRSN